MAPAQPRRVPRGSLYGPDVEIIGHEFTRQRLLAGDSMRGAAYEALIGGIPGQVAGLQRRLASASGEERTRLENQLSVAKNRWLIEEFFKCLKTGCAYEKRQLESLDTLLVALALLAPIAWQLVLMRHLTRERPETSATVALTARQIAMLRTTPVGSRLVATPSIREALFVVARLGGHLRQNGEPGWLVLARGMQKLRCMETGWAAAEAAHM